MFETLYPCKTSVSHFNLSSTDNHKLQDSAHHYYTKAANKYGCLM